VLGRGGDFGVLAEKLLSGFLLPVIGFSFSPFVMIS
jgi:hypothetical protein